MLRVRRIGGTLTLDKSKKIHGEINLVIKELESQGIDVNEHLKPQTDTFGSTESTKGLGDVVEEALQKFGITEERFKEWFNLKECNCSKRKKWLNGLFSWKVNQN